MGVIYQRGQELDEGDLRITFRDNNGTGITTLTVRYSIYYLDNGTWTSLGDDYTNQTPESSTTAGKYWVDWIIETGRPPGCYQIRWDYRENSTDPWKQSRLNFQIVRYSTPSPVRAAEVSDLADEPICIVR